MATEVSPMGTKRAGVGYNPQLRKWQARIKRDGEVTYLGNHETEEQAIAARDAAEIAIDGKVSGKRLRSAFDDEMDAQYPLGKFPVPAKGMLPELPATPAPACTVTPEELFAFIQPRMTLMGKMVVWDGDARKSVHHLWGKDCESHLTFTIKGERQVVRHAEVSWMLTHKRPIPAGHMVKYSDGNVMNRDTHNLWLVKVTD